MSGAKRTYPTPMEQHPSESLPDEVIPNDAPQISSPEEHQRAIQDARIRGTPVDSLPWSPNGPSSSSQVAPVEQSPAESLPDEMIPNDAPPFPGSSTEGGNVSNGLSTWPSSTQTSSADISASSSGGIATERPRLAPLTTIHGHDPSEGELMRSPISNAPTEMPPPPYTRGQSSQAQTAIAATGPPSAGSGEFLPPQHNYPGLPPGVSPASAADTTGSGSGSQDALLHGAMQDASSRTLSGSEPSEAVALPKYSHRPQDGNARVEEQPDGSYKMFPAQDANAMVAMRNLGGSDTTSDPEAQAGAGPAVVQQPGVEGEEQETRNPLRKMWRRHFKGPHNKRKRAFLISAIFFVIAFLVIFLAVMGAKRKLSGQGDDDGDSSDSDDDDDDDDDDE